MTKYFFFSTTQAWTGCMQNLREIETKIYRKIKNFSCILKRRVSQRAKKKNKSKLSSMFSGWAMHFWHKPMPALKRLFSLFHAITYIKLWSQQFLLNFRVSTELSEVLWDHKTCSLDMLISLWSHGGFWMPQTQAQAKLENWFSAEASLEEGTGV